MFSTLFLSFITIRVIGNFCMLQKKKGVSDNNEVSDETSLLSTSIDGSINLN